jgi:hypothetical protein
MDKADSDEMPGVFQQGFSAWKQTGAFFVVIAFGKDNGGTTRLRFRDYSNSPLGRFCGDLADKMAPGGLSVGRRGV